MDKRTFVKNTGLLSLGLSTGLLSSCKHKSSQVSSSMDQTTISNLPSKWVWARPDSDKPMEDWKPIFEKLANNGIEGFIPQVYSSRETLFEHPTLPVKKRWLEEIIPIAHSFGLEVHAWMWTMPLNNEEYWTKHSDWFSVNRNGQPSHTHPAYVDYYKFMCPCHPEVREFVGNNVKALAAIEDLDGVHLDYVRQPDVILAEGLQPKYNIVQDKEYPEYDYPYSERCRIKFKAQSGIDPIELGDDAPNHDAWRQFRYDQVSELVNLHCVPEAHKMGKKITAAVFPNWESVRQQWHKWNLDGFLPMLYNGFYNQPLEWIGEEVIKAKERLPNDKPIYAGLFMNDIKENDLEKTIDIINRAKADGFSIFSLEGMKEYHWHALERINNKN